MQLQTKGQTLFRTGGKAPISGVYRLVSAYTLPDSVSLAQMRIPLAKGRRFPPCRGVRGLVFWTLESLA
jgi:hypothetical protein